MKARTRSLVLVAFPLAALGALAASACGDDSSSTTSSDGGGDANKSDANTNQMGTDGSTTQPDGSSNGEGGSGTDGSTSGGEAGTPGLGLCGAPIRVDKLGGAYGGSEPNFDAVSYLDRYVVSWLENGTLAGDGHTHVLARVIDSTTGPVADPVDLGTTLSGYMHMGQDGAGEGFISWQSLIGSGARTTFNITTATFDAATTFDLSLAHQHDISGASAGKGLAVYVTSANSITSDTWTKAGGFASAGTVNATTAANLALSANASGKAVAEWSFTPTLYAAAWNGTAWGTPVAQNTVDAGFATLYGNHATLSDGNAVFIVTTNDSVYTSVFHADTGVFDAPVLLQAAPANNSPGTIENTSRQIVADGQDRLTATWTMIQGGFDAAVTWVSRSFDKGKTWSTPFSLGASNSSMVAAGPDGRAYVAIFGNGQNAGMGLGTAGIRLRAAAATGTTWSPETSTGVETAQQGGAITDQTRLLFDTKGHIIVVGWEPDVEAGSYFLIRAANCTF
jgi:hypothetical protein